MRVWLVSLTTARLNVRHWDSILLLVVDAGLLVMEWLIPSATSAAHKLLGIATAISLASSSNGAPAAANGDHPEDT